MQVRPFRDGDLERLQETVAAWIAQAGRCAYDHIGELAHRIYDNLRGRPIGDLVSIWEEATGVVGVAIVGRFGNAFDVFTAPTHRGSDVELEMVRHAAELTERMTREEWVLTDVFDCETTRMRLLEQLGFARFRVWDRVTERSLGQEEPPPDPAVPEGFLVRSATYDDAEHLAIARNLCFGQDWTGSQYRTGFMEKTPGREIVAQAPDGRIAAFTVYWTDPLNRIGHFEPVGTHPEFRRRGLARAVMLQAMREMAEAGMRRVTVNHAADNTSAGRLYSSLGFTVAHETYGYRRLGDDYASPEALSTRRAPSYRRLVTGWEAEPAHASSTARRLAQR
jgi:ribosomal protein S18 acetylase RimI-like enzyme